MSKLVLVTGGTGFVGKAVLRKLAAKNIPHLYSYSKHTIENSPSLGIELDLLNESSFKKQAANLEKVTDLIHAAAFVPSKGSSMNTEEDFNATVVNTVLMLRNILFHLPNIQRIVLVSSCYVELNDPSIGFYGIGKKTSEDIVHQFAKAKNIPSVVARFPQIYGPGETHGMYINKFAELVSEGKHITLDARALNEKDTLFIDDVAEYLVHALGMEENSTVSISSKKSFSVKEIADMFAHLYDATIEQPVAFEPRSVQLHFKSTYNSDEFQLQYDVNKGVSRTVEYYRNIQERTHV